MDRHLLSSVAPAPVVSAYASTPPIVGDAQVQGELSAPSGGPEVVQPPTSPPQAGSLAAPTPPPNAFSFVLSQVALRSAVKKVGLAGAKEAVWYLAVLFGEVYLALNYKDLWAYYRFGVAVSPPQAGPLTLSSMGGASGFLPWLRVMAKAKYESSTEYVFAFDGYDRLVVREHLAEPKDRWAKEQFERRRENQAELRVQLCTVPDVLLALQPPGVPGEVSPLNPLALRDALKFVGPFAVKDNHVEKMRYIEVRDGRACAAAKNFGGYTAKGLCDLNAGILVDHHKRLAAAMTKLDREATTWRKVGKLLHIGDDCSGFLVEAEAIIWSRAIDPVESRTAAFRVHVNRTRLVDAILCIMSVLRKRRKGYVVEVLLGRADGRLKMRVTDESAVQRYATNFDILHEGTLLPVEPDLTWSVDLEAYFQAVWAAPRSASTTFAPADELVVIEGCVSKTGGVKALVVEHTVGDMQALAYIALRND